MYRNLILGALALIVVSEGVSAAERVRVKPCPGTPYGKFNYATFFANSNEGDVVICNYAAGVYILKVPPLYNPSTCSFSKTTNQLACTGKIPADCTLYCEKKL